MAASLLGVFAGADATTAAVTTGSRTTTSGSLVTGCGGHWSSTTGTAVAITSSLAGTYTELQELEFTGQLGFPNIALAYNIGGTRGASHTITSTQTGGENFSSVTAQEWDGIQAAPTVVSATATGNSTAPSVSVAVGAASLAVGMVSYDNSPALTITPNGATQASEQDEDFTNCSQNVSFKVGQTGTPSIAWTLSGSGRWGAIIAAFTEESSQRQQTLGLLGVGV